MSEVYLLGANKAIDTAIQVVKLNQEVLNQDRTRFVVCRIEESKWGISYHLIKIKTCEFRTTEIIQPISEKFGIGYYYDDSEEVMIDPFEVAVLLQNANKIKKEEEEIQRQEREESERIKAIGRKRLAELLPKNAQAVIVAQLKQDESDSQTDYFASSTQRTVILGFSTHKKDIFSEMRKHASNFEETAYLAEYNADYEHREKYSMGSGYYLGQSKYYGWIINKEQIYELNSFIERHAYTAGNEANICITQKMQQPDKIDIIDSGNYQIVDYSEKALAVFGDTKPIKDLLKSLGGRFNRALTHKETKQAGWVFPKKAKDKLTELLAREKE